MDVLIKKAKRRDPDAFTELMQGEMQNMYRTARAIVRNDEDAADAIQDTILTCWEKLDTLRNDQYFRTWLTRILINHCYQIIRKNQNFVSLNEMPEPETGAENENIEWKEAIASMDEKYRLAVILYYCEGFRTKEIAKMLNASENTIRTWLARGRKQLRDYYREEELSGKEQII